MASNRVAEMLGVEIPIIQAPMGYIARAQLASAVSNAGAMGIIETSSGELDAIRDEITRMRDLTDRPFGVNIAQLLVRDPGIVHFVADQGVRFVTTSAGDPAVYTATLKAAGITVFHVVPSLRGALKAVDAGVHGLVVEGIEGGGFKNPYGASSMILLPLIASQVDIPIVAAGGVCDATSMAAAFVLGAEGAQMGTRMLSAAESPVHANYKAAIVGAGETDTLLVNRSRRPAMRVLRSDRSLALEAENASANEDMGRIRDLYFGGDMESSIALAGQVTGRIEEVRPVAEILRETWDGCRAALSAGADRLG